MRIPAVTGACVALAMFLVSPAAQADDSVVPTLHAQAPPLPIGDRAK